MPKQKSTNQRSSKPSIDEVLKFLNSLKKIPNEIVFQILRWLLAYLDHSEFEIDGIEYILIPVLKKENPSLAEKTLEFRYGLEDVKERYADIIYVEADESYHYLHTVNQKYHRGKNLNKIEKELNDDRFLRIHKKYLVN